jgi:predicted DNA-binding protein
MGERFTVRLPRELAARLARVAESLGRPRAEVARRAIERFVAEVEGVGPDRPIERVRDLLGSFESGVPDLGRRHREHLLERLRGRG